MTAPLHPCARCGFGNRPGDQFCGSCGTFLAWDAEPAAPMTVGAAAPPPSAPGTAAPVPAPSAVPGTPEGGAGLVRCPGCGIANPPTRTFCQSCGATLAGARPVVAATPESIAAAVARTPERPAVAIEAPARPAATGAATASRRGGLPGWILGMILLGLLAGAAVTAFQVVSRPQLPPSEADPTLPPASSEPAVPALAPGAIIGFEAP